MLPLYEDQGLAFFPVFSAFESERGGGLLYEEGVQSPVIVDAESELFRRLRVAGFVFPLNVVIDRDGTVVHVDNQFGIDPAVDAIQDAL